MRQNPARRAWDSFRLWLRGEREKTGLEMDLEDALERSRAETAAARRKAAELEMALSHAESKLSIAAKEIKIMAHAFENAELSLRLSNAKIAAELGINHKES